MITRKRAWSVVKWVATFALVALVFRRVPLRDLGARLGSIALGDWILLTVLVTLQVAISVVRWWRLLRAVGERIPYLAVFGDLTVGILYNMLLPTSVGGDVVRAIRMRARTREAHHAWSTSIFERLAGLLAMGLGGATAAAYGLHGDSRLPPSVGIATLAASLAFLAFFSLASVPFRIASRAIGKRLPAAASRDVDGIAADLAGPLAKPAVRIEVLGWSLAYQGVAMVFVIAGARALGANGHETAILVGMPLVYVLGMIPVTIGGHGLREGLYVFVLGTLGMPEGAALGLAALWLISSLAFAVSGLTVLLLGPSPTRTTGSIPQAQFGRAAVKPDVPPARGGRARD